MIFRQHFLCPNIGQHLLSTHPTLSITEEEAGEALPAEGRGHGGLSYFSSKCFFLWRHICGKESSQNLKTVWVGLEKVNSLIVQLYAKSTRQGCHLNYETREPVTLEIISEHLKISSFRNNPVTMPDQTNFHSKASNETYLNKSCCSGIIKNPKFPFRALDMTQLVFLLSIIFQQNQNHWHV